MKKIIIIGKKNVGKSSLFNLLTKTKNSININYSGYTRDCNNSITKIGPHLCEIIDTAGLGFEKNNLDFLVLKQTWKQIKQSNIIIFVKEINDESNNINKNILNIIKKFKQQKIYVINKIDVIHHNNNIKEEIENEDILPISVKNKIGISNLINKLKSILRKNKIKNFKINKQLKISIIGKTNVGKSSLVNKLTKTNQMITYNQNETTRDNVDVKLTRHNKTYTLTDTPGIKKKTL